MRPRIRRSRRHVIELVALSSIALTLVACSSSDDSVAPSTTAETDVAASTPAPSSGGDTTSAEELDLGALAVETRPTGFSASAEDAERCGSSQWHLSGPVEYIQASPVPAQCFGGAHAFDTNWYGLSLPAGDYVISLTVSRGDASGTTSSDFTIGD